MKYILFDLDGTIINSQQGVTRCVQYALKSIGIEENDLTKLTCFIGPPLTLMFGEKYGITGAEAEALCEKYRERYDTTGIYECELYEGMEHLLINLRSKGYKIGLASSKPETACLEILKHFQILRYFDCVTGASLDASRREKVLVLQEAFRRMQISCPKQDAILIGDTKYDVIGTRKAGIDCLGITYGFGTRQELEEAGAVAILDTTQEVEAYFKTI